MAIRLPSRYEDLDDAFRGRLRPDVSLISLVQNAYSSMSVSGGIRFLPLYGASGSGKSCAARELATHLPECRVVELSRAAINSESALLSELNAATGRHSSGALLIALVDQYEERVAQAADIPGQFVERLSLLDRGALRQRPVLFIWLTTSRRFQADLAAATTRNQRILIGRNFELIGPPPEEWADIVDETFSFHNQDQPLADFEVLRGDVEDVANTANTIGQTIEGVGVRLANYASTLQNLSEYQVLMLWPVTDGLRITRVAGFTNARDGYKLDWSAFYRELTVEDRANKQTLSAYNRARLYFDVRLIPIAAADLMPLCRDLDAPNPKLGKSYLSRFGRTHLVSIIDETWDPRVFSPLRERESERAVSARDWYVSATTQPVALGRRLALILRELGKEARYEERLPSKYRSARTDVWVRRPTAQQDKVLIELKAFAPEGTRPSSTRDAVKGTLRKYAQFAGFIEGD